jgi:NAD+ synthase
LRIFIGANIENVDRSEVSMESKPNFGSESLAIDARCEAEKIGKGIREYLALTRKKGVVVGMSGGIDSSVVTALCVRALGKARVLGLHMPERESSADTMRLSRLLSDSLGIESIVEDMSALLEAAGCYRRRDEALRKVCPDFGPGYKVKIVLPSLVESEGYRLFSAVILDPKGKETRHRLDSEAYLGVVAATNFKQRVRKMMEYHHADRLNYAVAGTPNRLEYDQGFFVKLGDGAADLKPIAHLYKTQVYQMAASLGVPEEIRSRPPTTDTYSLPQSQEEFYFSLPYGKMDLCLLGKNTGSEPCEIAAAAGLSVDQVERVFRDIDQKRRSTEYLHLGPRLFGDIPEVVRN